ncbi:hypothetical protein [Paenibacillus lautus]|uniref:hypothetical protein n=1 Tax=Paenibacillus lautus TaxID=1401 RepID=UPI001C7DA0B7|nr:hypothetical protein [Paenibacillus lautus]MBX4152256.1 hypothetical protein [Paenibacillus lautus]
MARSMNAKKTESQAPIKKEETKQSERKVKKKLDENILVPIASNVDGTLIYKGGRSGQVWKFTQYGDEDVMELSELRAMLSSNRAFLEKGWIKVLDDEVIDYLNLQRFQKNVIDRDNIEYILTQGPEQIKQSIKESSANTKTLIFSFARDKFLQGELTDYHTIKAIEEGLGQPLNPTI